MSNYQSPDEKSATRRKPYRIAIVLAIVVFLVLAPEIQEGNSMDPAVADGQVVVAYKLASYSAKRDAPKKDTLVVLDKDISLEAGADDNIITRVIAVPGDTVEIKDGEVYVNDEVYVTRNDVSGAGGSFKRTKLKGNQVFVLGDNRTSALKQKLDSRNPKLGLVDMRKIRGNILVRIWPLNKLGIMTKK